MPPSKRSKSASKKAKAKKVKAQVDSAVPSTRASAVLGTSPRRSSVLQGFSHHATPRISERLSQGHKATRASRSSLTSAHRAPPAWFDGADYEVNDEGEIIGVAARRFADSVERDVPSRDADTDQDDTEDVHERPSLLAQRRQTVPRADTPPTHTPSALPFSFSPPPRLSPLVGARLRDPFVDDVPRDVESGAGRGGASPHARQDGRPSRAVAPSPSRHRRSGATAPASQPLVFHHFDDMTAIRVRLGVVPLPHAHAAAGAGVGDETETVEAWQRPQPRVTFVERFLNPRKFFQLPATSPGEPPVDILGWSGVYSTLRVWLPAKSPHGPRRAAERETPKEHARSSSWWGRLRTRMAGMRNVERRSRHAITAVDTAASVTVVLSP